MKLTISVAQVASWIRQGGAIAAAVIGAVGVNGVPLDVRTVLIAFAGAILTAEHAVAGKRKAAAVPPTTTSTGVQ